MCCPVVHDFNRLRFGKVHSVFRRAANAVFGKGRDARLLTLVAGAGSILPDSLCVPDAILGILAVSGELDISTDCLHIAGRTFRIVHDGNWNGRVRRLNRMPDVTPFLCATQCLRSGFDSLPRSLRARVDASLRQGDFDAFLGLGPGLTPSFDDACVGIMAYNHMVGDGIPQIADLSATTDVSAYYLRLAMMGCFSQPLLDVIAGFDNPKRLTRSLQALFSFGATSGADMVYGIR